jgi:hypothetical protein
MDLEGDSDIDLADLDEFLLRYDGDVLDCDDNGQPDLQDILLDPGLDRNGDGRLDLCDCAADFTGPGDDPDGAVDSLDFLLLLSEWGGACPCTADITGPIPLTPDGSVDALDLLLMISQWGSPASCAP